MFPEILPYSDCLHNYTSYTNKFHRVTSGYTLLSLTMLIYYRAPSPQIHQSTLRFGGQETEKCGESNSARGSSLKVHTVFNCVWRAHLDSSQEKPCDTWQVATGQPCCICKWKMTLMQMSHQDSWNSRTQEHQVRASR